MRKILAVVLALSFPATSFADISVSITKRLKTYSGTTKVVGTVTFDSSYPTNGESFSTALGSKVLSLTVLPQDGYVFETDLTNKKIVAYRGSPSGTISQVTGTNATSAVTISQVTGAVADDDSADSNGTAVNIVPLADGIPIGYLQSTTAGNADSSFDIGSGGPTVVVDDSDSPGGVAVYFDEDAANDDERFLAINANGTDMWVISDTGDAVKIAYDASADSNGVALYFDDDAANAHERLLFISPTDAAGSYKSDDAVTFKAGGTAAAQTFTGGTPTFTGSAAALSEVSNGTNLSTVTANFVAEII